MITPEVFHRLRAAQLRAVREQELLSGRDWILICACAHMLAMVYPLFLWLHVWLLSGPSLNQHLHPAVIAGFVVFQGLMLLAFWWWAHYAPFRAARGALIVYLLSQFALGYMAPHLLVKGASFKALILLGLIHAVSVSYRRRRPA